MRILGVLFCERCAREQDAYFTIGELTQSRDPLAEIPGLHGSHSDGPLLAALRRLRRGAPDDTETPRPAASQGALAQSKA